MFSKLLLKKAGLFTLIAFIFLITTTNYSFANEEDVLLKARKYYQQGNYDESVKVLQKFIENLRAIVEQKKNVAEAFYLLAKVYYTVGEDAEVDKNLKKVYETFPSFYKEETDLEFKKKVMKIRKEMGLKEITVKQPVTKVKENIPVKKVIVKEGKKKKKFPILLVVGGVVVLGVVAFLLLKKKKEEVYDIRGQWNIHENVAADGVIFKENIVDDVTFTFTGQLDRGTFVDEDGFKGVYTVNNKTVLIKYINMSANTSLELTGSFSTTERMNGDIIVRVSNNSAHGKWNGTKKTPRNDYSKKTYRKHSYLVEKLLNNN